MKNFKFHSLPLETPFLQKIRSGVQYSDQNHYTNFDGNSFEIRPFKQPLEDEHWPADSIFRKILKTLNLHNMKYLTKLEISIEASFLFNKPTLRQFTLAIVNHFKTLKQLEIRFLSCSRLNCENLKYFLSCFVKGIKSLTKINIHFLGESDIDDQCLKDLKSLIFKRCKQVEKLELIVSGYFVESHAEKNHYFTPNMEKWLEMCTCFHDCTFCYGVKTITLIGAAKLCSDIARYFRNLESLAFEMPTLRRQNKMTVQHVVKMIAKLHNLKSLSISFAAQVDDEYIDEVSSAIGKKLKTLQSLTLWLHARNENITDEGLKKLASNIFPALSQLTYFAFNLNESYRMTDAGVINFGIDIANHLKKLETLILNFHSFSRLTNAIPSKLTQTYKNSLLSLRKLVLDVEWDENSNETNERYHIFLPERVQTLELYLYRPGCLINDTWKNLKQLSIVFYDCYDDTDFLDMFSKSSPILKNLTELKLICTTPKKVTDEKVDDLTTAIGTNLQNLTSLELRFSHCEFLTSKCLTLIVQNICKKLEGLVYFHLRVYEPKFIDSESLISLISLIATRLQKLESLTLFFYDAPEKSTLKPILHSICTLIPEYLKRLKEFTLKLDPDVYDLDGKIEMKQQIRKHLCQIPILYLS